MSARWRYFACKMHMRIAARSHSALDSSTVNIGKFEKKFTDELGLICFSEFE